MLVYENPAIREISPQTLGYIFTHYDPELYIPLTFLTYQIDYQISGQNPFLYHFDNLVLHTLNALLVAWLIFVLCASVQISRKAAGWIAIFCGLLFAVHPLHTEAVEWVSARKDVLSTFFFLLSLIGYLYWRERDTRMLLILSMIAFVLGLMSKVMVITLPVIILLVDWLQGRKWNARTFIEKTPYFGAAVIFGIIAVLGKTNVLQSSTLSGKILMACKSAVFYLQQIFWPFNFSLLYPYTKPITLASPDFFVPILIIAAILALAFWSLKYTRIVAFGLLFYLITVAPTFMNFAKGGDLDVYFASDRYAYVPSIGIFLIVGWVLWKTCEEVFGNGKLGNRILTGVGSVAVIALAILSFRQSFVWQNTQTLFQNVIKLYPESSHVAHNNIGNVYRLQGDYEAAIDEYKQAIAIRPLPKTISNLGATYRKLGNLADANAAYSQALQIRETSKEAHFGLGLVRMAEKRYPEAEKAFKRAIELDPKYEEAYTNLGALYVTLQRLPEAIDEYKKALAINEYFPDARYNLAVALEAVGKPAEAIEQYEWTVRMVPNFIAAHINLGLLYYQAGNKNGARAQFEQVLRIDPQNRSARSALQQMGAQ